MNAKFWKIEHFPNGIILGDTIVAVEDGRGRLQV